MKKEKELCQSCCERPISFGRFCNKCMAGMKKNKQREQRVEMSWRATEFDYGD